MVKLLFIKLLSVSMILIMLICIDPVSGITGEMVPVMPAHKILLLNSYHKGYSWTDEITRGVEETLAPVGHQLHVEYMDSKRHTGDKYYEILSSLLLEKHSTFNYKVIICSDNNAFEFLKKHGERIFGKTPVIFCGVNYLREEELEGYPNFTGINEATDVNLNLDLINRLHPDRQQVTIIADNSTTGIRTMTHIRKALGKKIRFDENIRFIYDTSLEELGAQLRQLNNKSIILYATFLKDNNGNFIEYNKSLRYVCSNAKVPVYGVHSFSMGLGILGGHLIDGYSQGQLAANQALKVVSGVPVSKIPIIWNSPVKLQFDYRQLKKFNISTSRLPKNSEILYGPGTFYHKYKFLFWNTVITFFIMTIALVSLVRGLVKSRNVRSALTLSEKKYRKLFETTRDAIVILDIDKGFIDCNPAALKMFSAPSKEEFCSVKPEDVSPERQPDGALSSEKMNAELRTSIKEGSRFFEWQNKRFDGYEFPSTILVLPMKIDDQTIFQGTIRDVSDKKANEKALNDSEERLKLAMSIAKAGVWDWDIKKGTVLFDNRSYIIAGYKPGDFPATIDEWRKRVHPSDMKKTDELRNQYQKGDAPHYQTEFRFRKKDGSWMWIMTRGKIIEWNESNEPVRFIGTHSDITELKQTEKALQRAQKMDAVGQLTGGIAHDFNNILSIILGNLDLIRLNTDKGERLIKWAQAAHKAAMRASDLTRKLLSFSRRQAQFQRVTNLNNLIGDMQNLIKRSLTPQVEVDYIFQKDVWMNELDPGDFEDSLINLILNARDAMPDGGQLTIETSNITLDEIICKSISGASPGEYVQISVSDNGIGIEPDHIDHIFEPFFTTKSIEKGTGLGLSMVFGFIKRSGGHVKVYSENHIGTTFRMYLPKTDKGLSPAEATSELNPLPRGTETILLVDDETELCKLGKTTLESLGYNVLTATDGNQALQKLTGKTQIDLLFSDIVMPGGINGYELAEQVAELVPDIKILLTSGYSAKAVKRSPDVPFQTELLNKPYTLPVLAKKIRTELDKKTPPFEKAIQPGQTYSYMEWSESLSIGIDEIDNDHKRLLSLFNDCRSVAETGDYTKMSDILNAIITYTKSHFLREELVMDFCDYPQLKNHVQVHRLLVQEATENKKRFEQNDVGIHEILDFLTDWLQGHIHGMDKSIMPYVIDRKDQINNLLSKSFINNREGK